MGSRRINLSNVLAGQTICIREVDDKSWLASFLEYGLGFSNKERDRVEPGSSPGCFATDQWRRLMSCVDFA
jgi:putative transposase